jgi:hypothetical protein
VQLPEKPELPHPNRGAALKAKLNASALIVAPITLEMQVEMECFFACPYCAEQISMLLDTSVQRQTYIEDCEVCCHPIEVCYAVKDGEVCQFEARAM